ncbi:TonB-dependent receptor domain-containing protein [Marinobacterium stanieri]|uniref:Outer membrane receptor for ferrienterochelin and colicins n=1 Tax=Marinobacterium stanieri TaxID=49186 RepID=A0A1N6NZ66_9GAMM|nr:TonB-dependent receptor [Marinobacterium stanieri]SIP97297.1 outer membrane receptor for ferrienterochelin and colicins [Marinobacterium stanieri]
MEKLTPNALALAVAAGMSMTAWAEETVEQQDVVITAAGFEQNIVDAPASISVISREELEKKSYNSVVDAVKNIPGVYVTGGGNMQDISIRGMDEQYTLYLIDGRPISAGRSVNTNGSDGGKQIALPPIAMIERIEVIRGPMSSLYGSEAMGGVINIITRRSSGEWSGTLSTEFTKSLNDVNNDEQQVNLFAGGSLIPGLLSAQVNGSWLGLDESDFAGADDSAASKPDTTRKQGGVKFTLTPDEQNAISFAYDAARLEATSTPGKSITTDSTGSNRRYDKDVYVLGHDGRYGDLFMNTFLQHDVSDLVQDDTKREEITTFNSQGAYFLGDHTLTFGGQYKYEDFTDETNGLLDANIPGAVKSADRWLAAVFAEMDWAVTEKLNLTTGLRYNDDELFGGHLTPRVYANYRIAPDWMLKGGVSTGYKQPGLADATEGFGRGTGGAGSPAPHPRAVIIGNPDLKPEESISYEMGFVFDSPVSDLSTSLMLFHTDYKDKIAEERLCEDSDYDRNDVSTWDECSYGGNPHTFVSTRQNIDEAEMRGIELSLDYNLTPSLRFSSSYTYTDSEQKSGEYKGEPLNKIPKHMVNASLDWQKSADLNLWTQANYRGKTSDYMGRRSMSDGTPGYGFVDVGLAYQLTANAQVKAGIYNLLDKEVTNESYGVVLDGRRLNMGLNVNF